MIRALHRGPLNSDKSKRLLPSRIIYNRGLCFNGHKRNGTQLLRGIFRCLRVRLACPALLSTHPLPVL